MSEVDMPRRYELTDAQCNRIKDLLCGKEGDRGRSAADNRTFVIRRVVGPQKRGLLVPHAREIRQLEEQPQTLHPLGQSGSLGRGV
jgi:hypothetical protein